MANFAINIPEITINFAGVDPDTKSGNPIHAQDGRFGVGSPKGPTGAKDSTPNGAEKTPDQLELDRMFDQIRIAARTLTGFDIEQVKNFLDAASNRELSPDEVQNLYNLVKQQVLTDLVAVFDQQKKKDRLFSINVDESWKSVRIGSLTAAEKINFKARLQALGWSEQETEKIFDDETVE